MKKILLTATSVCFLLSFCLLAQYVARVLPSMSLLAPGALDQDDMAVWVDHENRERSTIITADKGADRIFVYDLGGQLLQTLSMPKPGNVDIRYGFPLAGERVDIVAYMQRKDGHRVVVFAVEAFRE